MCHSISIYLDNMYVSSFHNRTWAVGREQPNGDLSGGNNVLVTHDPSSDKDMGIKPWYDMLRATCFLFFFGGGYFKLGQRNGQRSGRWMLKYHQVSPRPSKWGEGYTNKCDLWSLGVIVFMLLVPWKNSAVPGSWAPVMIRERWWRIW